MRAVIAAAGWLVSLLALMAAAACIAAVDAAPAAASGAGQPGSCSPYVDGTVIPVPCSSSSWSGGTSGSGGSGSGGGGSGSGGATVTNSCAATVLGQAQATALGLSWPPPTGHSWALLLCLGGVLGAGPQVVLIDSSTGAPAVTPQQLLITAVGELHVPYLQPTTAPPRGHDGLVGLPEWFWVAASSWHARTVTVTAGAVWATVTAAPVGLTFRPGPGLNQVTCTGPGTSYNPHEQSTAQHTDCSYTYLRPSTGQPGNAYLASVAVTWRITWTGSGGAGGLLDAALQVAVDITVPVAQGEALVTSP
jgi:hypothetical protein